MDIFADDPDFDQAQIAAALAASAFDARAAIQEENELAEALHASRHLIARAAPGRAHGGARDARDGHAHGGDRGARNVRDGHAHGGDRGVRVAAARAGSAIATPARAPTRALTHPVDSKYLGLLVGTDWTEMNAMKATVPGGDLRITGPRGGAQYIEIAADTDEAAAELEALVLSRYETIVDCSRSFSVSKSSVGLLFGKESVHKRVLEEKHIGCKIVATPSTASLDTTLLTIVGTSAAAVDALTVDITVRLSTIDPAFTVPDRHRKYAVHARAAARPHGGGAVAGGAAAAPDAGTPPWERAELPANVSHEPPRRSRLRHVIIDHSNTWLCGQRFGPEKKDMHGDLQVTVPALAQVLEWGESAAGTLNRRPDPLPANVAGLTAVQGNALRLACGSSPPKEKTPGKVSWIWTQYEKVGYATNVIPRVDGKERAVDSLCHGPALQLITDVSALPPAKRGEHTLVIATGDGGRHDNMTSFPRAVWAAAIVGMRVEVWGWAGTHGGFSGTFRKIADRFADGRVTLHSFEPYRFRVQHRWVPRAPTGTPALATGGRHAGGAAAAAAPATVDESDDEDSGACCICLAKSSNTALIPCGHKAMCDTCTPDAVARVGDKCPVCAKAVTGTLRVFD